MTENGSSAVMPEYAPRRSGPSRGYIAFLAALLVLLLLCCCLIVGATGLYYVSPEFHDMVLGLLSGFLAG